MGLQYQLFLAGMGGGRNPRRPFSRAKQGSKLSGILGYILCYIEIVFDVANDLQSFAGYA